MASLQDPGENPSSFKAANRICCGGRGQDESPCFVVRASGLSMKCRVCETHHNILMQFLTQRGNAVKHLSEGINELSTVAGVARLQGSPGNARILANPATIMLHSVASGGLIQNHAMESTFNEVAIPNKWGHTTVDIDTIRRISNKHASFGATNELPDPTLCDSWLPTP